MKVKEIGVKNMSGGMSDRSLFRERSGRSSLPVDEGHFSLSAGGPAESPWLSARGAADCSPISPPKSLISPGKSGKRNRLLRGLEMNQSRVGSESDDLAPLHEVSSCREEGGSVQVGG